MKWTKVKPGAVRARRGFAFLPVTLDDQSVVWLDFYWECHRMTEFGDLVLLSVTEEYPEAAMPRPKEESRP